MKRPTFLPGAIAPTQITNQITNQITEEISYIWSEWRRQKLPLYLFLALSFNLILAPAVFAATGGDLSRTQSWALGLLGLVTVALSIYLFVVMFQPERF